MLSEEKRLRVLAALVDGNSIRAVSRMTDVHQDTIGRFALMLGEGAQRLHNRLVRDLRTSLIQVDEVWSYVQKKQARVTPEDGPDVGEAYTFVGLCALSRLVISYHVGKRDQASTNAFTTDLRARLLVMPQMTSDGFAPYITAIGASFGPSIAYGQMFKNYSAKGRRDDDHRYEPPRAPFITKKTIYGVPDPTHISTAYVERNNLTTRHHIGRMRRLCLAFSKRLPNHRAAVALHFAWYNFCHVVKTLRVSPAVQAGVTDHVWELSELLAALLSEVPCERPAAQPLEHLAPEGPARALPNGRGFLRLVTAGDGTPAPRPEPSPEAPSMPAAPALVVDASGQIDLFSWTPPRGTAGRVEPAPKAPCGQLNLFDD